MKRKRMSVRVNSAKLIEDKSFNFTFQQAFEYFISAKKSEGLRDSTIGSNDEHYRFFITWLEENHPDGPKQSRAIGTNEMTINTALTWEAQVDNTSDSVLIDLIEIGWAG
jgi:hypothetical protein